MSQNKPADFVTRICERTLASKIPWEKTSTESLFQAIIAGYIVRFLNKTDGNLYIIEIYNSDNELVDKFDDEQFDGPPETQIAPGGIPPMFDLMQRAFAAARRKAMGVEDALDNILSELQDDNGIPL